MNRGSLAAVAALSLCTPANAVIVQFQGTVDQQAGDNSEYVQVGDTVTVFFDFDPATQLRDMQHDTDDFWFPKNTPQSAFNITTSRGLLWTATDEIFDEGVYLAYGQGEPEFHAHSFTKLGPIAPEFHYFPGVGTFLIITPPTAQASLLAFDGLSAAGAAGQFSGTLSYVSSAPEPATWGMMVLGFAAAGLGFRRKPKPAFV